MNLTPYVPLENINFIGRLHERKKILEIADLPEASIMVVHGRRRVGKTELIEQTLKNRNLLKFEGIENQPEDYQINSVISQLSIYCGEVIDPKREIRNWRSVLLLIAKLTEKGKWTLYFEEFQWLCNYNDKFVAELKFAWDNYFRRNNQLLMVLCGSSPSFMVNKVVKSSSLYNRSLNELPVGSFSIEEAKEFLGKDYSNRDVFDAYLFVGGIPEYLRYLKRDPSILLALCKESFVPGGFFVNEAEKIFVSSMGEKPQYRLIVDYLAQERSATRAEIASELNLSQGGNTTDLLEDLEACGLISKYTPYRATGKSKTVRYVIADNYLQFYYRFIEPQIKKIERGDFNASPVKAISSAKISIWRGLAFERLCRASTRRIAKILGFSGVEYVSGVAFKKGGEISRERGFQWDLVFERRDNVHTLCEVKYTEAPVGISVIDDFIAREEKFAKKNNYRIQRVLISAAGVTEELRNRVFFDRVIELKDLI